jgi:hypothetical protein
MKEIIGEVFGELVTACFLFASFLFYLRNGSTKVANRLF